MPDKDIKKMYSTKNVGNYPDAQAFFGQPFEKREDLRYGTNPHQRAAFYRRSGQKGPLANHRILKPGKQGLSQTNLEDISQALSILRFWNGPACAVMKHVNPSGVAAAREGESLVSIYRRARDCDPQAAFGCTTVFNRNLDAATAEEIMGTIVENVAAPGISPEALAVLSDSARFGRNKEIRVIELPDLDVLTRWSGEAPGEDIKVLIDGSLVVAEKYLSSVRGNAEMSPASASKKDGSSIKSTVPLDSSRLTDLLLAWYVTAGVRSNGVVIVKNLETLAVGTGQQDRVTAVDQAIAKVKSHYKGQEAIKGAVLASDGYFPFADSAERLGAAGLSAAVCPGGSIKDFEVIEAANRLGVALLFTGERCFSHH